MIFKWQLHGYYKDGTLVFIIPVDKSNSWMHHPHLPKKPFQLGDLTLKWLWDKCLICFQFSFLSEYTSRHLRVKGLAKDDVGQQWEITYLLLHINTALLFSQPCSVSPHTLFNFLLNSESAFSPHRFLQGPFPCCTFVASQPTTWSTSYIGCWTMSVIHMGISKGISVGVFLCCSVMTVWYRSR